MIIKSAEYRNGATIWEKTPKDGLPEFAFIGRSNVGKSSLINMLTQNKKLAQTSQTPGKTILINHYLINKKWYLVDLPGYGYARRSKSLADRLENTIRGYIDNSINMYNLFVLIDANIPPQKIDMDFIRYLGENGVPFSIVFTKTDKSSHNVLARNILLFHKQLEDTWEELPRHFLTSSAKASGREELLAYMESILNTSAHDKV